MIATFAQLGYGMGLLMIVPLGDLLERKRLMMWLLALVGLAICLLSFTPFIGIRNERVVVAGSG